MKKYQALRELCNKMIQPSFVNRSESCEQILKYKHLWALMDNELDINKEFKEFSDNSDKGSDVFKLIQLMAGNAKPELLMDKYEVN